MKKAMIRVDESGYFLWPWVEPQGLLIICGAAGGGGGGGGALCLEELNVYGSGGGSGGGGGEATSVKYRETVHQAAGGNGGGGGDGGGLHEGKPVTGKHSKGCLFGDGGRGGHGAIVPPANGRIRANGSNGGKGFPGETRIIELTDISVDDRFEIRIGSGGAGGDGGKGYETGDAGASGANGFVLFVPLITFNGD